MVVAWQRLTEEPARESAGDSVPSTRGEIDVERDDALDRALDALGDSYRRRLLARLHDSAPSVGVAVTGGDADDVPPNVHHVHLPKLERHGYVETTHDSRLAYRGENFDEVAAVMRVLEAHNSEFPGKWP